MFTGSLVALVTPFNIDQSIDFNSVKNLISLHLQEGSDGIIVGGTTGEGPTLEGAEFEKLLSFVVEEVDRKIPVIAGTGSNCTRKTVAMTKRAKELGADGALLILPYYNKPTDRGVLAHFRELDKLGFPLIPYHHPGRCGIELDVTTLIELMSYENVACLKECSKNKMALRELLEKRPDVIVLSGDDDRALEMIQMGAKGCISVIANLIPGLWRKMIHLSMHGNFIEAELLQKGVKDLLWALSLEVNPQPIKCAMAEKGLCKEVLRLPLVPVDEDTREEIVGQLRGHAISSDLLARSGKDHRTESLKARHL